MQLFVISGSGDAPLPSKILLGYTANWTWFPPEIHPLIHPVSENNTWLFHVCAQADWAALKADKGKQYVLDWLPTPMDDGQRFLCSFLSYKICFVTLNASLCDCCISGNDAIHLCCEPPWFGEPLSFFCNHCSYVIFVPYPDLSLGSDSSGDI